MTWYFEQADHFGIWHPRTQTRNPEERTLSSSQRRIRRVVQIDGLHEEMPLDELRAIYGTPVREPDLVASET